LRIIAISNHKGGTGKTTTCANLGVALTEMNKRVLAIDLDPQASLSVSLGINTNSLEKTIYNALLERGFKVENAIIKARENLDLLPSNRELAAAEVILIQETGGELVLRKMLEKIQNSYDYILIDCPPNLGKLTINALVASDEVIIPVSCSFLDIRALGQLLETVETIKERLNPYLDICGILLTKFTTRTLHSLEVAKRVREIFKNKVFKTTICNSVRFKEAPVRGETILEYVPTHKGAMQYRSLAKEVIKVGKKSTATKSK